MNELALHIARTILPENFSWEECIAINLSLRSRYDSDEFFQRVVVFYYTLYEFDYPASTLYSHWMFCKESDDDFIRFVTLAKNDLKVAIEKRGYQPNPSLIAEMKELRKTGLVPHYKRRITHES